jgi:haloacetate dehalogenase
VFEGFESARIETAGGEIFARHAGSGPPLLLLHGYPQTHVMWHAVAPRLSERFTVVCPDLRGYGDSAKPPGDPEHERYSKRELARDQVEVMRALGFERFALAGHDRGARVAHRLALDHREAVTSLAVLDIVPTRAVFAAMSRELGLAYYHWLFLAQPPDLPERMIGADPAAWVRWHLRAWTVGPDAFFDGAALAEYERCFADPAAIHASCEDYRAGATIDLVHDEHDLHLPLACPVLALWGGRGRLDKAFNVLGEWRERAARVDGRALDAGHFLAEERPAEVAAELAAFCA